ncbi:MAG: hypothetical protein JSU86_02790 [Phycisphaerales bacterium]|nr:MAG: hypothetical protein JSU86_02790 [Phycisphaerales bacterium]
MGLKTRESGWFFRFKTQDPDRVAGWLNELREKGLIWAGSLLNKHGQAIMAAALTNKGRELVG